MRGYGASDDPDVDQAKNFDFAQDVTVAIDFLQSYAPQLSQQIHVFGHSLGGAVALAAQARDARIQKTISFGPPRRLTERFLHPEAREKKKLLVRWQADMQFAQPISYAVWEQVLQPLNIETYVDQFAIAGHPPLFLIDAEQEPAADLEFLRQIYQQAAPPIEYWTVPQTDHYLGSGYLFGVPCYRQSIVQDFVRRIDRWLQG
jgi:pimeloyl-ACP methyl ester carboxylesterase